MHHLNILLFLGGIGFFEGFIGIIVFSVIGFFICRIILKALVNRGPGGINAAAAIMGLLVSPILVGILFLIFYSIMAYREVKDLAESDRGEEFIDSVYVDTLNVDVARVSPQNIKVLLDNEFVRVFEYTIKPGEKDIPHTHPSRSTYVVNGGKLRVYPEGGEPFDADEVEGTTEWGDPVGKHYVENIGNTTVKLLVTENKLAW